MSSSWNSSHVWGSGSGTAASSISYEPINPSRTLISSERESQWQPKRLVLSYRTDVYIVGRPERMYRIRISSYDDRTATDSGSVNFPPQGIIPADEPQILVSRYDTNLYFLELEERYESEIIQRRLQV